MPGFRSGLRAPHAPPRPKNLRLWPNVISVAGWFPLLVVTMAVAIYRWTSSVTLTPRAIEEAGFEPVSAALGLRLGPALTRWLTSTRSLRVKVAALEEHSRQMLARADSPNGEIRLRRQTEEASFLARIRDLRTCGRAWREQRNALNEVESAFLTRLDLRLDQIDNSLQLAWVRALRDDRHRGAALARILHTCLGLAKPLAAIDHELSAEKPAGYR